MAFDAKLLSLVPNACGVSSLFSHVTFVPGATVISFGANGNFWMVIVDVSLAGACPPRKTAIKNNVDIFMGRLTRDRSACRSSPARACRARLLFRACRSSCRAVLPALSPGRVRRHLLVPASAADRRATSPCAAQRCLPLFAAPDG